MTLASRPPDPPTDADASRFRAARQRDTSPELALRRELHRRGLRFRVEYPALGRQRVDICFPKRRVAVFVDGCFWHGCPVHATWPKNNAEWWRQKIEANKQRDARNSEALGQEGWRVLRVWEHEDAVKAADRVEEVVRESDPR